LKFVKHVEYNKCNVDTFKLMTGNLYKAPVKHMTLLAATWHII